MAALHEGVQEAVSEGASLSGRVIELLSGAGLVFSIAAGLAAHPELGVAPANRISQSAKAACNDIERVAAANGINADLGRNTIFR